MKALIIGATGATGKDLINILIKDDLYTQITLFIRRQSGISHSKITEIITDFNNLENIAEYIDGDVLFSCLGTTLAAAGSKENQRYIDYSIPLKFAETAKRNKVPKLVLLSAYGASISSKVFYSRIKGELEEKIAELKFESIIIFKPGFLLRKETDRKDELITGGILHCINSFGILRKFKPLSTAILAEKLVKASKILDVGKHVIELENIFLF